MQPLFLGYLFGRSLTYLYLCTLYGTELYLDSFFRHCVLHRIGEVGAVWRLRCVSCHDGFYVLVVKDGV